MLYRVVALAVAVVAVNAQQMYRGPRDRRCEGSDCSGQGQGCSGTVLPDGSCCTGTVVDDGSCCAGATWTDHDDNLECCAGSDAPHDGSNTWASQVGPNKVCSKCHRDNLRDTVSSTADSDMAIDCCQTLSWKRQCGDNSPKSQCTSNGNGNRCLSG